MRFLIGLLKYKKKVGILYATFFIFIPAIQGQTLSDYLLEAAKNAPSLQALALQKEGNLQLLHHTTTRPKTTIGIGYFATQPQFASGVFQTQFSLEQSLPWFGTQRSFNQLATVQGELDDNALSIEKRKLFLEVKKIYYRIYEIKAKQKVLQQQDTVLSQYQRTLKQDTVVSKHAIMAMLQLQVARNELHYQEEILKGDLLNAESAFNMLLHRDGFEPIRVPDNLIIPDEEPTLILDEVTYHPELAKYDHLQQMWEQRQKVHRKKMMPEWTIGLAYTVVDEFRNSLVENSGEDIVMPYISLALPLFSKSFKKTSNRYALAQQKVDYERNASEKELAHQLETAMNDRITARIQYHTQQKNSMAAEEAFTKLNESITLTTNDAKAVVEIQRLLLDAEYKKIEAVATYFIHTAVLSYLN